MSKTKYSCTPGDHPSTGATGGRRRGFGAHVDLTYKVTSITFNTSDSIKATATAVVNATKRDPQSGLVTATRIFDRHRSQMLTERWPRFFNSREIGQEDVRLTLLAGFRLAPEVMTSIFEAIDWLGFLDMNVNSTIYNAEMFFNMSMTRPEIVIGNASDGTQAGLMLKEDVLTMHMACENQLSQHPTTDPLYNLLYAKFGNASERMTLDLNGTAALVMQLLDVNVNNATVDVFKSDSFVANEDQLKSMAQYALNQSLPTINDELRSFAIPFPPQLWVLFYLSRLTHCQRVFL